MCWLAELAEDEAVCLPSSHVWVVGILQHLLQPRNTSSIHLNFNGQNYQTTFQHKLFFSIHLCTIRGFSFLSKLAHSCYVVEKPASTAGSKITAEINTLPVPPTTKPEAAAVLISYTLSLFSLNTRVIYNLYHHSLQILA